MQPYPGRGAPPLLPEQVLAEEGGAAGYVGLFPDLRDSQGAVVREDRHTLFSGALPPARMPPGATREEDGTVLFSPSLPPGRYRLSPGVGGNSCPDAIPAGDAGVGKVHYPPARTGYDRVK